MSSPDRGEQIRKLAKLIEGIRIAMLTTRTPEGRLVTRPLGTQEVEFDGDLWFATAVDSGKVEEIQRNPQVSVAYAEPKRNTYVSVSGRASIVDDRAKIDALWSPAMKVFFPEGKDDPRLRLIRVQAQSAEYWDGPGGAIGQAIYFVTAAVTGNPGALSENEQIDLG